MRGGIDRITETDSADHVETGRGGESIQVQSTEGSRIKDGAYVDFSRQVHDSQGTQGTRARSRREEDAQKIYRGP